MSESVIGFDGTPRAVASPLDAKMPERAAELHELRLLAGVAGGVYLVDEPMTRLPRNWKATGLNGASGGGVTTGLVGEDASPTVNYALVEGEVLVLIVPDEEGSYVAPVPDNLGAGSTPGDTCVAWFYRRVSETVATGAYIVTDFDFSAIPGGAVIDWIRIKTLTFKADEAGTIKARFQDTATMAPTKSGTEYSQPVPLGALQSNTLGEFGMDAAWTRAELDDISLRLMHYASAGSFGVDADMSLCRCQVEVAWRSA